MIPVTRPDFGLSELAGLFSSFKGDSLVKQFETEFARLIGARYALSFPYGRSALYALLKSQGLIGSEVIMPAYTCIVVSNAIVASENVPVFVDISLEDFNMDLEKMKESVSPRTKGVIATHMYGYLVDIESVRDIVPDDVLVIEDAALAFMSEHEDKKVGSFGDAGFFSFNLGKQISTVEGAMVVTNNEEIYMKLESFRQQNFTYNSLMSLKRVLVLLISQVLYHPNFFGIVHKIWKKWGFLNKRTKNWSLSDINMPKDYLDAFTAIQAAIGLAQLRRSKESVEKRRFLAQLYDQYLRNLEEIVLPPLVKGASYSHYTIRVKHRDRFREEMIKLGVYPGRVFDYCIPSTPSYHHIAKGNFNNSQEAASTILNLPLYPSMSIADVERVCKVVGKIVRG